MKFNPLLNKLNVYEPGKPIELVVREFGIDPENIIKLASNENPNGCSQKATKAVQENAHLMYRYPDDSMMALKSGLSRHFDVNEDNIIIGAGSDQVIEFACHAKLREGSKILQSSITFAMYQIYAAQCGASIIKSPGVAHDLDAMFSLYKEHHPDIIFLCVPNNPTGDSLDASKVDEFIDKIDRNTLVIVDGAYQEYAAFKDHNKAIDPKSLIAKYPHVLYLGTFSKAYGLGGMRVGYGIASSDIIKTLYKLRPPFNITTLTLLAAQVALEDQDFVKKSLEACFSEMKEFETFAKKYSIEFIKSYTNFITFILDGKGDSTKISDALLRRGIIVRNMRGYGLNAIRVTIGNSLENKRFFDELSDILNSEKQ